MFLIIALILAFFAALFAVFPLLMRRWNDVGADQEAANIALFSDRLAELEKEKARGILSPEDFSALQLDLDRNLLMDATKHSSTLDVQGNKHWLTTTLLVMFVGLGGFGAYQHWGASEHVAAWAFLNAQTAGQTADGEKARAVAGALRKTLHNNPDDVNGLFLVAQIYMAADHYREAANTYKALVEKTGDDPTVLAQLVQAQFLLAGGVIDASTKTYIDRLLIIEPANTSALNLVAVDAYKKEDYQTALKNWRKVLQSTQQGTADYETVVGWFGAAYQKLAEKDPDLAKRLTTEPEVAAVSARHIRVDVSLSEAASGKFPADTVVFVYAKSPTGMPAPLAVQRLKLADLPTSVVLDDSSAMIAGRNLSSVPEFVVGARVSQSGDPIAKPGDWQGLSAVIQSASTPESVRIVIDTRVE